MELIYKYKLLPNNAYSFPSLSQILKVGVIDGDAYCWIKFDPHYKNILRCYFIDLIPTGREFVQSEAQSYFDTLIFPETKLVFHVFVDKDLL